MHRLYTFLILCFLTSIAWGQKEYFNDPDPSIQARLEDWKDLKFGLLMHWGPYSQWNVVESWSICPEDLSWAAGGRKGPQTDDYFAYKAAYEKLPETFYPSAFEPERWARSAHNAGMKYMVFTTKHHDGFCMFDTKTTDYKITNPAYPSHTLAEADVTKAITDAFRKHGFWTGLYFSKPDWHSDHYWWKNFPPVDRNCNYSIAKYPEKWEQFKSFTHNQIDELMTDYGKIDILWLDGGWVRPKTDEEIHQGLLDVYEGSRWQRNPQSQDIDMAGIVEKARKKQPGLIVVDRAVPGIHQNYLTPEQHIPEQGLPYPWETCMTMANSWSYVEDDTYKSTYALIRSLVDIVSKGGNLLLNIGPGPDGRWHEEAHLKLDSIGQWMMIHGQAIYGTRPSKVWHEGDDIRFTSSKDGRHIYVFLLDPAMTSAKIESIDWKEVAAVEWLTSTGPKKLKMDSKVSTINLPSQGNEIRVVKLTMK